MKKIIEILKLPSNVAPQDIFLADKYKSSGIYTGKDSSNINYYLFVLKKISVVYSIPYEESKDFFKDLPTKQEPIIVKEPKEVIPFKTLGVESISGEMFLKALAISHGQLLKDMDGKDK